MFETSGNINKYRYLKLQNELGRSLLSTLYPNDFEHYLCAFELVEHIGSAIETVEYFVFPVQPSSIQKTEPRRTNIKTAMSSINVLKNSSAVPQEITIKGNFGKHFKIMTMQGVAFSGGAYENQPESGIFEQSGQKSGAMSTSVLPRTGKEFSVGIKTGYGATKLLQRILQRSNEVTNSGSSLQLYFYNMALGESYLVTIPPTGYTFSQSQETNMIWQYSLSLIILAPLSDVLAKTSINTSSKNLVGRNAVQSSLNFVAKEVSNYLVKL